MLNGFRKSLRAALVPAALFRAALLSATLVAATLPIDAAAQAQTYPAKAIRFIVPYAPGGGADIACRIIAQKLQENVGQPVLVDNRPGASEIVGTEALVRSAPDGYTIGFMSNTLPINATLQPRLPYDGERDLIPVTRMINVPLLMLVPPSLPVTSVKELVALAKAQPGKLNYASFGTGGPHGLAMEWFKSVTGSNIVAIPYKGVGPAIAAMAGGEIQVMLSGLTGASGHIKAGKVRAIGVTAASGVAGAPDVPAIARDYPEFDMTTWYGLAVPAGTPANIVARIHSEITKVLTAPDVRQRFEGQGVETAPMAQDAFIELVRKETQLWAKVIKSAGITLN
jgi:tripartite-type tricarboxylate transporter receptor subunit TctC